MKTTFVLAALLLGCSSQNNTPPSSSAEGERAPAAEVADVAAEEVTPEEAEAEPQEESPETPDAEPEPEEKTPDAEADTEPGLGDGAACTSNDQCASGTCEGEGCGDENPGTCMPAMRMCLRDLRPFCGCDGKTFMRGSNCPGKRFAARGPCDGDPPSPQLPPR
jgi:hypothetical protein